jgi:hypothetical protein
MADRYFPKEKKRNAMVASDNRGNNHAQKKEIGIDKQLHLFTIKNT